jgi:hypothetical protein
MLCIPVHSGQETLTHYLSCSGRSDVVSIKIASGHVMPKLYVYIRWDLQVT